MKSNVRGIIASLTIVLLASCFQRNNDLNITVSENEDNFKFSAHFPESRTHEVGEIIDKAIAPASFFSSGTVHVDATTTLEDKTFFYIKASPGDVSIKFDRDKNTKRGYERIRNMCEEIKESLGK